MLELLCILVVVAYVLLERRWKNSGLFRPQKSDTSTPAPASPVADAAPAKLQLSIAGTQRAHLRDKAFVKGFGVQPQTVHDIRTFSHFGRLEDFPVTVVARLRELYDRGCAVGTDVMGLLCHGRGLRQGEALYFALVEAKPEPRVVAFVDRLRIS